MKATAEAVLEVCVVIGAVAVALSILTIPFLLSAALDHLDAIRRELAEAGDRERAMFGDAAGAARQDRAGR